MADSGAHPFPVVGVGASAGGLGALTALLDALPPRPGLALVVIQHLDPHQESRLASLLQPHTSMTVLDAVHGAKVLADRVYVIQPNTNVAIADGVLSVTARPDDRRPHYPVDHFLRSLATVQGPRAVGVILSGTGSDGTLGVCEVKAAGGVTFAQDDASAQHPGMPQSAVASGSVDVVLPPLEIGTRLGRMAEQPYLAAEIEAGQPGADTFQRVIAALQHHSGVDFSQYRDTTIKRRAARRMLLRGFRSPQDYAQFLERDRTEAEALYRDVLINVTSFFRDPEMFDALRREVFPAIMAEAIEGPPLRVWVPGCSTGQEAYSLAMALLEFLDSAATKRPIQIFATDLGDPSSLDKARAGVYPESIEAEVSPERLKRFFTKEEHSYRIRKHVRDLCVFARQNLTADPPFSRVDLVTCRNVLIYMSPALQERLLPVFHFALNPSGFLVLGMAETIGPFGHLFELVDGTHKIYRRKESTTRPPLNFPGDSWLAGESSGQVRVPRQPPADFQREADRLVVAQYAPPSVLVNYDFDVQQFRGRTAPFIEAPAGQPTTNLLRMAKEGLFTELHAALNEAKATKLPVVRAGLRVLDGDTEIGFTLRVIPVILPPNPNGCLLVLFEGRDWPVWPTRPTLRIDGPAPAEAADMIWLRQELVASRQHLQSIVDQQELASQELRSAHEEVLSSNEELQSTNEELETTKEELQSANEELTTVNEQFQSRNRDLDALADDLSNFISSADLPMVTVGRDLCVRRLTPAAERAFNLLATDIGRSLEHIKFSLAVDHIGDIIEQVILSTQPWEREMVDRDGRWWVLRVRPFRTADGRIDGATMVAVDIDLLKRTGDAIEERDYARAIVQTVREPLVVLDAACRVGLANEAFYELFAETPAQIEGRPIWETSGGVWSDAELRRSLIAASTGREPLVNCEIERIVPGRGRRVLVLNARNIVRASRPPMLLLAVEDVTDERVAENLRVDSEALRRLDRRKDEFLGILAHELRNPLAPMRFALEIMKRSDGDAPETARARQALDRQVTHMVRIVDDLLDASRITQGKLELRKESIDLAGVVTAAVELCRPVIEAARHTLTLSLPDERVMLFADPIRITQVLVNLLNNAAKFTPPGGHIWLIAETMGEGAECPDQLRVRVRDTGIGLPADVIPSIFEMFMQGDRSLERTRAGLGVGLTLVRNLVSLHGGTVEAHSGGKDAGSEFIVCLPIDPQAQPGPEPTLAPRPSSLKPLKILVVDDNADGRELLSFLLAADGHTVETAGDGHAGLSIAATFQPQVAILDLGMPGMNGYALAQHLRQEPNGSSMVLVALSGLGQQNDRLRAIESGFDRHFTKPVDIRVLRAFLDSVSPE